MEQRKGLTQRETDQLIRRLERGELSHEQAALLAYAVHVALADADLAKRVGSFGMGHLGALWY